MLYGVVSEIKQLITKKKNYNIWPDFEFQNTIFRPSWNVKIGF